MNLVAQGPWLTHAQAAELSRLAGKSAERISEKAFRLRGLSRDTSLATWCDERRIDHAYVSEGRRFADLRLLAMDMDSTLITIECIDELGTLAGKKAEVAAVTAQAMRGEIDYPESLRRRVAAIAGLPESALLEVYAKRLHLTAGAEALLATATEAEIAAPDGSGVLGDAALRCMAPRLALRITACAPDGQYRVASRADTAGVATSQARRLYART